jgi:hypothetical protein
MTRGLSGDNFLQVELNPGKPTPGVEFRRKSGEVGVRVTRSVVSITPVSFAGDEEECGIRVRHELLRFRVVASAGRRPTFEVFRRNQLVEISQVPRVDLPNFHP